jgi:hypothetical protein
MNSDDVKRLREMEAEVKRYREREEHFAKALRVADGGQYRADWDGAIARVIRERDAAAEERDRLRRDAKVVLDGAIRASVDRDRALTAARELREALEKQAVHRVSRRGGERQWCQICDSYTAPYSPAREEWLKVTHASGCALASTAWLTDGGDNG